MSAIADMLKRIPKRKPKTYPMDHERYHWIGEAMSLHAMWRPVRGGYSARTDRGRALVWARFKKMYPWAFIKP